MDVRALFRTAALLSASLLGAILAGAPELHAQNSAELSAVYGRGVHAYFANQSAQAEQQFTQVIQAGSSDPRVFYFRAMVRMRMGRQYEAENDMRVGADYEARNPGSMGSIGKALERVQGHSRRKLEKFRRQARLNRVQVRRHQSHARYEKLQQRETQVLRKEIDVPLELLLKTPPKMGDLMEVPSDPPEAQPVAPEFSPEKPADVEDNVFGNFLEPEEAAMPEDSSELPMMSTEALKPGRNLAPEDKVKSSKLLGILGRVVGQAMPWKNIRLPQRGPPGMLMEESPDDIFELGPVDEAPSPSEPPADEADPFSEFDLSDSQPPSEPSETEETPEEEEMSKEEETEESFDNLFEDL